MISCRYVGSDCCMIGDREFDAIGQRAVFSEQSFREAVLGNAHFIAEEDFLRCKFTSEELEAHGRSGDRIDPPASFCEKVNLAQAMWRDARRRLESGDTQLAAEVFSFEAESAVSV